MSNQFENLEQAFEGFRRNALHEFTPPQVLTSIKGGFYAGAQAFAVLLSERNALSVDENFQKLFAEMQTYFEVRKAEVNSRQTKLEKKDVENKGS